MSAPTNRAIRLFLFPQTEEPKLSASSRSFSTFVLWIFTARTTKSFTTPVTISPELVAKPNPPPSFILFSVLFKSFFFFFQLQPSPSQHRALVAIIGQILFLTLAFKRLDARTRGERGTEKSFRVVEKFLARTT